MNLFSHYLEQISRMQRSFHDVDLHDLRTRLSVQLNRKVQDSMFDDLSNVILNARNSHAVVNNANSILRRYGIDGEVWISAVNRNLVSYVIRKR